MKLLSPAQSVCICLPCLVKHTLPLERNPFAPIASLRGRRHHPQVASNFYFLFFFKETG